jgi:hypothetical protein
VTNALFPIGVRGILVTQRQFRVGSNLVYTHLIEGNPTPFFACERMRATISVPQCARLWTDANVENSETRRLCRGCPTGAHHAGAHDANLCDIHNVKICSRCRKEASRLIFGNLCVSCRNREYEYMRGYNARGTPLTKLKALEPRQIRISEGGSVRTHRVSLTASVEELIVGTLRDAAQRVVFGYIGAAQSSFMRQMRLF